MKYFKHSVIIFCLLIILPAYASDFPTVQVSQVMLPKTKSDWAKIFNVNNINEIASRWPELLKYVQSTPAPFEYVVDEKLKTREDFENSDPTTLIPWLDEAINIVKSEEKMKNISLEQQKKDGTTIISKLTKDLLKDYCDHNQTLNDEKKAIIMGNAPIQIDLYLDKHWTEDWLIKARKEMQWVNLNKIIEEATFSNIFNKENEKYVINTEWLCNARKEAESDIKTGQEKDDPTLAAYFTKLPKHDTYPALSDAKKRIIDKVAQLLETQLIAEGKAAQEITDTVEETKQNGQTAFDECIFQPEFMGPSYTQKWENLDKYLETNKVEPTKEEGTERDIGVLTNEWLQGAIAAAKDDRTNENMKQDVALREATKKIKEAIPNISNKDNETVHKAVENGLKKGWFEF